MLSWEALQHNLEQTAHRDGLEAALLALHDQQVEAGVVAQGLLEEIATFIPLGRDDTHHFLIQWNPTRKNRGVSPLPHPNPPHTIPFRGGMACFCCLPVIEHQWPKERGFSQKFGDQDLIFLPNIAPIFTQHFTVISPDHRPQDMDIALITDVAQALPGWWVIQNGPDAGATNPWHFHLQVFQGQLPLTRYTSTPFRTQDDWVMSQVDHPAGVVLAKASAPGISVKALVDFQNDFLAQKDSRRLNLLARALPTGIEVYFVLRDTTFKTDFYKTGQPGYAEVGGIISVIDEEGLARWKTEGYARYEAMMQAINPGAMLAVQ
ncbi:MAG: DUF4922 domain-containing protein [Candidatus Margulisiibacteriota bacterium]